MSYKEVTKKSYNATAEKYAENVENLAPLQSMEKLLKHLPPKARLLDIGCGSGRDAKIFSEKGLHVTGIDICPNLLKIAQKNAPLAAFIPMDMEEITLPKNWFDCAWASSSLPHIAKDAILTVFQNIHAVLKEGGYFYFNLKKGTGSGLEKDARYTEEVEKFWAYYEEEEIRELLQKAQFELIEISVTEKNDPYQTHDVYRVLCKKPRLKK